MPISLAIVEDDRAVRASLRTMLQHAADCRCLGDFGSAEEALRQLPSLRPDVILMDINLPGISGVECVRQLRVLLPATRILMLTVREDADSIFSSLAAGASGYLLKPVRVAELAAAVKEVSQGCVPMTSIIARKAAHCFKHAGPSFKAAERLSQLEQGVLNAMAKGFTCKETADLLGINASVVQAHIERIYRKLHVQSRSQVVAKYLDT